jgi:hypothetical protein
MLETLGLLSTPVGISGLLFTLGWGDGEGTVRAWLTWRRREGDAAHTRRRDL